VRARVGVTAGALISLMLGGCGSAGGPGGSAHSAHPSASQSARAPEAGACYLTVITVSYPFSDQPMDCAKAHRAETVSVGIFTGAYAERVTPPPAGSPAVRWAFRACDTAAKRFVGGDWRGARLSIQVVVPSPAGWTDGSRWYRCDIFELDAVDGGTAKNHPLDNAIQRTGSLRGAITRRLPLVYTCFNRDEWENLWPVACGKSHRFEYVGVWTAPDIRYDDADQDRNLLVDRCRSVITRYVGKPKKTNADIVPGVTYRLPSPEAWERGDHGVRCFLWSDDGALTRSVKGAGLDAVYPG
jgi:hypothetical protein